MIASNTSTPSPIDITPKYFDVPINIQNYEDKRAQLSIERLNLLLTKEEQEKYVSEKKTLEIDLYKFLEMMKN